MLTCDGRAYPSRVLLYGEEEIEAIVFTKFLVLGRRPSTGSKTYCKVNEDGKVIYQQAGTNSMEVIGITDRTLKTKLKGNTEAIGSSSRSPGLDTFEARNLRFAKDDANLVWVKGQGYVVKVNEQNFVQSYELSDFFPQGYAPLYICTNTQGDMIYGYSTSARNSVLSINRHDPHNNRGLLDTLKKFEIPSGDRWVGMDVTFADDFLVFFAISKVLVKQDAGSSITTVFKAEALGNFYNGNYEFKFNTVFSQDIFKRAHMVRRVKGYNLFLVACFNSVAVFDAQLEGKKFVLLKVYENIYEGSIVEIMMIMDMMFPIPRAKQPEVLRYIDFNAELRRLMEDDDKAKEIYTLFDNDLPPDIVNSYLQPDIRAYKIPVKETSNFALIVGFVDAQTKSSRLALANRGIAVLAKNAMNDLEVSKTNFEEFDTAFLRFESELQVFIGLDKLKNNIIILDSDLRVARVLESTTPNDSRRLPSHSAADLQVVHHRHQVVHPLGRRPQTPGAGRPLARLRLPEDH